MLRFDPRCHVCGSTVRADAEGVVQAMGLAPRDAPQLWVWGPVVIHPECREHLETPHNGDTDYVPISARVTASARPARRAHPVSARPHQFEHTLTTPSTAAVDRRHREARHGQP